VTAGEIGAAGLDPAAGELEAEERHQESLRVAEVTGYAGALYAARVAMILRAFILGRMLGPASYGVVSAFVTFLAYANYLDIGLFHGINREVPMSVGAGRPEDAERYIGAARAGTLASGVVAATIIVGIASLQGAGVVPGTWWFTLPFAAAVFLQMWAGLPNAVCYAEKRFALQARATTAAAATDLVSGVAGAIAFGVPGVLATSVLSPIVQWGVLSRGFRHQFKPLWDWRLIRSLVVVGVPIELMWLAQMNIVGVDKVVVLFGLDVTALGYYTIAGLGAVLVSIGPNAVSQTLAPRVLERFGRDGHGRDAIRLTVAGQELSGAVAAVLIGGSLVAVPWAVRTLLPAYAAGIPAAEVLIVATGFLACVHPISTYMVGHGRQMGVALAYVMAAAFNIGIDIAFIRLGLGITGVALGSLATYVVFYVAMRLWLRRIGELDRRDASLIAGLIPVAAVAWGALVGAAGLAAAGGGTGIVPTLRTALVALAALAVAALPLLVLSRRYGFDVRGLLRRRR
jgi:O-antigen/teichoic acid export membrane protein